MKIPNIFSIFRPPRFTPRRSEPAHHALNLSNDALIELLKLSNRRRYKSSGFGVYLKKIPRHSGTFEVGIRNHVMGHIFLTPDSLHANGRQTPLLRPSNFVAGKATLLVMFLERLAQHLNRERQLSKKDLLAIETLIDEHNRNAEIAAHAEDEEEDVA
jgi:hypothetical protein